MELYEVIVNTKHLRVNTKKFENSHFFLACLGKLYVCEINRFKKKLIQPTNVKKEKKIKIRKNGK